MQKKILLYGYGNPGRQDDGLGNEFIERIGPWIETQGLEGIELDSNYQLNIEDADAISDKDIVLFIDASTEEIDDLLFTKVDPSDSKVEFSMHAVSTAFVLDLCQKLYNKYPDTYLLHIKGYEWGFKEGLSKKANVNLEKALDFVKDKLKKGKLFIT
jgi:hydrogenase maturation protease